MRARATNPDQPQRNRPRAQDAPGKGPASGKPARGGPASGNGWGGPARGGWAPFTATTQPSRAAKAAGHAAAKAAREVAWQHVPAAVQLWVDVADGKITADAMARVIAAEKIVERAEGKPERSLSVEVNAMTPEQRRAEIERLLRKRAPTIEEKVEPEG